MTRPAPRIDPEELLANAAWVRALARSLVGDAGADDVAQQTMVAAIERPPRAGVPLGAWMARVARNLSFNARRAERRRALHEAAAPTPATSPSPEESVARTEMFRVVVDAVLALEPIERDVVVLRFFDDLEMTEVALRLDVPVETARTRLKRALATLRARLDAECGDRRAWALALVGPGAVPRGATPTVAGVATAIGGALLAKKLAAAAALIALLAGGWYVSTTHVGGPLAPPPVETAAPPSSTGAKATSPRGRGVAAAETPPAAPVAGDATTGGAPTRWLLRGRLDHFDVGDGPRAKVAAYFWHEDMEFSKAPEPIRVDAAADGRFDVDFTASIAAAKGKRALVVVADHPAYLPSRAEVSVPPNVDADATGAAVFECAIDMRRAAALNVRVVDADGNALAGAHVGAFAIREREPDAHAADSAVTDDSGAARLRLPPGERQLVVAAAKDHEPSSVEAAGGTPEVVKFVLDAGIALTGSVVQDGRPVVGAELSVHPTSYGGSILRFADMEIRWVNGGVVTESLRATTDDGGRWRAAGLTDSAWRVRLDTIAGVQAPMGFDATVWPPYPPVEFDLAVGRLVAEVRCDGKPVAGVRLCVLIGGSGPSAKTDALGRAELLLAPGLPYAIQTELDGYREARVEGESPARGVVETLPIALTAVPPHGAIVVVVKDPEGRPIERAGLAFFTKDAPPWEAVERFCNGQNEGFLFRDVEAGHYRLVVRPGRHWQPDWSWDGDAGTWLDETLEVDVPTTGAVQYEVTARPGGRLRIAARDAAGVILPAKCEIRDASGRIVKHYVATRHGSEGAHSMGEGYLGQQSPSDVAEALPPGRYRVSLSVEGGAEKTVDAEIVAGKTCVVDVTLGGTAGPPPSVAPAQPK